jgi:L-amino acid N-acyltransferase YncA
MIVRPARNGDADAISAILNRIIAIGGTTAHQSAFDPASAQAHYIEEPLVVFVAEDDDGRVLGFQALHPHSDLPAGWADIATFVDPNLQQGGIGAALFARTTDAARAVGLQALNATIRADNRLGLRYYSKCGFVDYSHDPQWALRDGRIVGRVSKWFDLG